MKTCIVCETSDDVVKDFKETSFQKLCAAIEFRKASGNKYGDLIITFEKTKLYGFHSICYKRVISIKKKKTGHASARRPLKRLRSSTLPEENSDHDLHGDLSRPRATAHVPSRLPSDQPSSCYGEEKENEAPPRVTAHGPSSLPSDQPSSSDEHEENPEHEELHDQHGDSSQPKATEHAPSSLPGDQPSSSDEHEEDPEYEEPHDQHGDSSQPKATEHASSSLHGDQPSSPDQHEADPEHEEPHDQHGDSSQLRGTEHVPSSLPSGQPSSSDQHEEDPEHEEPHDRDGDSLLPRGTEHVPPSLLCDQPSSSDQHEEEPEHEEPNNQHGDSSQIKVIEHVPSSLPSDQPSSYDQHEEEPEHEEPHDQDGDSLLPRGTEHVPSSLLCDQPSSSDQHEEEPEHEEPKNQHGDSSQLRAIEHVASSLPSDQSSSSDQHEEEPEHEEPHDQDGDSLLPRGTEHVPSSLLCDQPSSSDQHEEEPEHEEPHDQDGDSLQPRETEHVPSILLCEQLSSSHQHEKGMEYEEPYDQCRDPPWPRVTAHVPSSLPSDHQPSSTHPHGEETEHDEHDNSENSSELRPSQDMSSSILDPPTPGPSRTPSITTLQLSKGTKEIFCVFCLSHSTRVGSSRQYPSTLTDQVRSTSIQYAKSLEDDVLCNQLLNSNIHFYHRNCLALLKKRYQSSLDKLSDESEWYNKRSIHRQGFECLVSFIEDEIIEKKNVIYLSDLYIHYKSIINELVSEQYEIVDFSNFCAQHLQNKIFKHFGELIVFGKSNSNKKIVYSHEIDVQKLADEVLINKREFRNKLNEVAYSVRNSVKTNAVKKLPQKLTPKDIIQGECEVPKELNMLISALVKGPDPRRKLSNDDSIKIDSVCQDLIYIISKGIVKPRKHLQLGLTVKSWTNSRKTIEILNKLGHSISYPVAEGLETELTYTAYERNQVIPSGISPKKGLSTHVAFDNYDRFVETTTGKDTLHDTVGIIYQNKTQTNPTTVQEVEHSLTLPLQTLRKTFSAIPVNIEPYFKKPKLSTTLIPIEEIPNNSDIVSSAVVRDTLWMMSLSRLPETTPMWTGYNIKTCSDESQPQVIDYLPQINLSPTSYAVVQETMKCAEKIRVICNESHIITTYDLAIAKMANQIKYEESPKYDNIFINFGGFHIQFAFFKALGKILDGCGIQNIMIECEVLAPGSVNGFLSGKHFNRCKRIHVLLSAAVQILHFSRFIEDTQLKVKEIDEHLQTMLETNSDSKTQLELPKLLDYYVTHYREFLKSTLSGQHGKTAEFYMKYVQLVNTYLQFVRSIKTNDFDLYSYSIFEMANLFFALNQQNYARWMLKYHYDLHQMKKDNPELLAEFKKGALGIKRTDIPLSRSPVDLVLEQTINANAGHRLTGLTHLTNSLGARQRWSLSHSIRTKIVSAFIEDLNVRDRKVIHAELQEAKLKKNNETLQNLINEIRKNVNPFDQNVNKDELFNISTGKAASLEISNFLLNVNDHGKKQKLKFIEECNIDPTRFEKPIKRNKINNFPLASYSKSIKDRDSMKITHIKMQRDIFGRLLAISLEKKIDIAECLSYPLAPAPPALSDLQGNMFSTPKSKLSNHLISVTDSPTRANETTSLSPNEEILLVDGFDFLRNMGVVPESFGKFAELVMRKLCISSAKEIHLIFDRYFTPSIKDMERSKRDSTEIEYQIVGPTQKTEKEFKKNLQNTKFKDALVSFLCEYFVDDVFKTMIGNKKIFVTNQEICLSYVVGDNNKIIKTEEQEYECEHEESDTRIIFHLQKSTHTKCLIKASDTDIMIIVLGNMHKFPNKEIWMSSRASKVTVNINSIYKTIGPSVSKALPGFHAYTGSDYTASFMWKGKIKPFKILQKDKTVQEVFATLNHPSDLNNVQKIHAIQKFTNELYGVQRCSDINDGRYKLFNKKYGTCDRKKFLKKIINFESHTIPPCWRSLKQKILRTIFVTSMWQNATEPICVTFLPESCGWQLNENNKYRALWFEGEPTPLRVDDVLSHDASEEEDNMNLSSSDEEVDLSF